MLFNMNNISISIKNLGKSYKLYKEPQDRLKEALNPFRKTYHTIFNALNNINIEIFKGEVVGIIGRNGAGKSTLLKIITGVLTPSEGDIKIEGKISSLLELGAGFNPDYSGLENIYLQGTLMGLSKQDVDNRLEDILEFADIGEFIYQPVKTYSSGMFARLAFSTAINVDPDILIVDEALSVGDMAFQEKCITKMKSMLNDQRTILFVSHSMPSIRNFCTKVIWLKDGKVHTSGEAHIVCEQYTEYMKASLEEKKITVNSLNIEKNVLSKSIYIESIKLDSNSYKTGDEINLEIKIRFNKNIIDYAVGVLVYDEFGKLMTLVNTIRDDLTFDKQYDRFILNIPDNDFLSGRYFISVSISDRNVMFAYDRDDYIVEFSIESKLSSKNIPISEGEFRLKHNWIVQ
uniref:Putative ABC transporter n=1 Tax=Aggregatibacter actinomycetemcomitans TaxID=714 RepID=W8W0S0_AGGAC|nr:putative ABC transporter [Aggregatibacter actinomycetemcomitans]